MIFRRLQLDASKDEWYAVFLSFVYCFCILAAYYVIRPMRDQLAVEAGSALLPYFFGITFVATLILTQVFSWLVSVWPRRVVMPVVYIFFIVCQLAFIPLWNERDLISVKNLGLLFFVWVSVFNLFVLSVFWSFMTDIWSDDQAKRLFAFITIGGTLGALVGPILTWTLVEILGLEQLLVVSAALLFGAVICIVLLGKWAHKHGANHAITGNEDSIGGGITDGLKQLFTNRFIGTMCVLMLLGDAIGTISYVLVTDYSGMAFAHNAIAQTRFAADMDFASNLLQIVLQLTITRWLLVRYGAGLVFAISAFAVMLVTASMAFANPFVPIIGIFPIVALVLIITRSLAHSTILAARESLYTLVPRSLRYKGKNAVDTVVWRGGDVLSLISISGLRTLGVSAGVFGLICTVLAGLTGWVGWRLANRAERGDFL